MARKSIYNWIAKEEVAQEKIKAFQEETGASAAFAKLCLQRGIQNKADLEALAQPKLEDLHDPFLMNDMQKGVDRIRLAIQEGQRILVYGDYDADGITSTTILVETLENLGADVEYYLPNRFVDGYGPNLAVFKYMIEERGIQLIVTCDNGVAGHEPIAYAMAQGVDVIVSDHHELPKELPAAYALIHPRHPEGAYPFGDLSGAGVAFKLATALLEEVPMDCLDVVAIGTIADLVSLRDENRLLVQFGLDMIKQTQRIGLYKLLESMNLPMDKVSAETVGFAIGPRLNAIGRLDDATPGVELLMTFDEDQAADLVDLINETNEERKRVVADNVAVVESLLPLQLPNVIVLSDERLHAGVLGIVASQIVEKTNRPTILFQGDPETGLAKGSARSVAGINIYEQLSAVKDLLVKFGGHEMAAGLTVEMAKVSDLAQALDAITPRMDQPLKVYDLCLGLEAASLDFLHELKQLEPFGTDNEKPLFRLERAPLSQLKTIGTQGQHLKGQLGNLPFIAFNLTEDLPYLSNGTEVEVLGSLSINEWNGLEQAQLQWVDFSIEGLQCFDRRSSRVKQADVLIEDANYIFFDPKMYDFFASKLVASSKAFLYPDLPREASDRLVLFDCPNRLEEVEHLLLTCACDNLFVMCHPRKQAYLMGMPTRQQFGQLYSILSAKGEINLKEQLTPLAGALKIKKDLLILMIQVFFEVKFVTIDSGFVKINPSREKADLFATEVLKAHEQRMAVEKQLLFNDFSTVTSYLKKNINQSEV